MKLSRWALALMFAPLAACSTQSQPPAMVVAAPPPPAPPPMAPVAPGDSSFAMAAAQSDMYEIQTSQMALEKARRPAVKDFAQHMIDAHNATSQKLSNIIATKGMVPPQQLTPGETKNVGILTNLPAGSRFDRAYLDGQIRQHRETLRALTSYAQSGTDPDLKAFAAETAPIVRQHLADAQKLMHGR